MGEKKNGVLSTESSRRVTAGFLVLALAGGAVAAGAGKARGISAGLFGRPRERALGLDHTGASLWRASAPGIARALFWAEAGEWLLYGIDDLRTHAVCVGAEKSSLCLRAVALVLDTPVGREAAVETGASAAVAPRLRLGTAVRWETAGLDGCERAHLVVLSLTALARLADRAALITRASNIRLAGEPLAGAGVSIGLVLSPESAVSAVARLDLSRAGSASFGVASRIRLGDRVVVSLGYGEDTGSLDGSVWIRIGSVGLDAGSSFHPVLGMSQGVFVSWGRGW